MTIRRPLLFAAALFLLPIAASAAVVLIYGDDAAVTAGRAVPAPTNDTGAIVPASVALSSATTMLIGDDTGLYHAVLFRLDNDLDVAVMRRGEPVKDEALLGHHLHRWSATSAFLSLSSAPAGGTLVVPVAATAASTEPFRALINGTGTDSTVVLKSRFNKAHFTLQVVNTSTSPVWAISAKLTSNPKLSFWKDGHRSGLNDVPEPELTFEQQALFHPIAPGASVSVSATAYYMKGKDYTWTVTTKSKALSAQSGFAVRIE